MKVDKKDTRIENEIKHGQHLKEKGAGEVWNWESPAGKIRWQRRVGMLTSHIQPQDRVLELGCGTGYFTKELIKTNAHIVAIDISDNLLNEAKSTIVAKNVEFLLENAYQMSFHDNIFDSVVGSSVLHHLDISSALNEIHKVLKPGGTIYFTEPNMMNPQIALQKNIPFIKKMAGDSPDETAFFRWNLRKKLVKYDFTQISIEPFDFLHPAIPGKAINIVKSFGAIMENTPILKEIAGSLYIKAKVTKDS